MRSTMLIYVFWMCFWICSGRGVRYYFDQQTILRPGPQGDCAILILRGQVCSSGTTFEVLRTANQSVGQLILYNIYIYTIYIIYIYIYYTGYFRSIFQPMKF